MDDRLGREAPVLLEGEGSGASLAASEIEDLEAAQTGIAHEMPVDEIIGAETAHRRVRPRVVGQDFIAKVEAHDGADGFALMVDDQNPAVGAEFPHQVAEVALGEDGRAEIAYAQRIEGEEPIDLGIFADRQAAREALTDDGALLAWDRLQIDLRIGIDGAAKGGVEILLARPVGMRSGELAIFQAIGSESRHQGDRGAVERLACRLVERRRSAVDAEGSRDERIAEESAGDMDEREHAADLAAPLGKEIIGAVAETVGDDSAPAGPMEEGRRAASCDKRVPFHGAVGGELTDDEAGRQIPHSQPGSSASSTRSIRSQAKSPHSRRSFPSMRARLV